MKFLVKTIRCNDESNDFRYLVRLGIRGGEFLPYEVSQVFEINAETIGIRGKAHFGNPSERCDANFWTADVTFIGRDGDNLEQFLCRLVERLEPHATYLRLLSQRGVEMECFVAIFIEGRCDNTISHELNGALAELNIDLRLDVHGS